MSDTHPENFELEINRPALKRYLRTQYFLSWLGVLCFVGAMLGFAGAMGSVERNGIDNAAGVVGAIAIGLGAGLAAAFLFALGLYLALSHHLAKSYEDNLQLMVEGPFLRIIEKHWTRVDRKLHFRSIVDYATAEHWLMKRFGLTALRMSTTSGGVRGAIEIVGVVDCARVRDALAEVDCLRE